MVKGLPSSLKHASIRGTLYTMIASPLAKQMVPISSISDVKKGDLTKKLTFEKLGF